MKMIILTSEKLSDSTQLLLKTFLQLDHQVESYDPRTLAIQFAPNKIMATKQKTMNCDLVIARLGMYTLQQGLHVLRGFEAMRTPSLNSAASITTATNKLFSASVFAQAGLPIPKTTFFHMTDEGYRQDRFQFPLVVKLPIGSQGKGVALLQNEIAFLQWLDFIRTAEKEILLQQYVQGLDLRVLVLKGQILASMARTPRKHEFRANLSSGGRGHKVSLLPREKQLAIEAAQILGLDFCGVDLIRTAKATFLIEANAFPGILGISAATKIPLARIICEEIGRCSWR